MASGTLRAAGKLFRGVCAGFATMILSSTPASAAANYQTGHIADTTFLGEAVMVRLDSGQPDNCAGTAWGWIKVPVANKGMSAFVIGLC